MGEIIKFIPRSVEPEGSEPVHRTGSVIVFEAPMTAPSINPDPWIRAAEDASERNPADTEWMRRFADAVRAEAEAHSNA